MTLSQTFLLVIGPAGLLGALAFGVWLHRRAEAEYAAQEAGGGSDSSGGSHVRAASDVVADSEFSFKANIDPDLGAVLGYPSAKANSADGSSEHRQQSTKSSGAPKAV
jgi:hypothetical protein